MNRRKFLSVTGCVVSSSVAGCFETEENVTKLGETISEKSADFTVQDLNIQQSVAYRGSVHPRVRNDPNYQYVIFGVDIHSDVNNRKIYDRFTVSTDGRINEELGVERIPTENLDELKRDLYLIYDVSKDSSLTDEHLKFSGLNTDYKWSLSDAINSEGMDEYVQNPPSPQVESFNVPNSMLRDQESLTVELTVSEDSDSEVTTEDPLKLLLSSTKISGRSAYTATVKTGETTTHDFQVPVYPNQGPDVETIRLNLGYESMSRDIEVRND